MLDGRRIAAALLLLAACSGPAQRRADFLRRYVQSVYEDSAFFKGYTPAQDLESTESARPEMTRDFEITRSEVSGAHIEYAIRFSNGRTGVVALDEQGGRIRAASLRTPRIAGDPKLYDVVDAYVASVKHWPKSDYSIHPMGSDGEIAVFRLVHEDAGPGTESGTSDATLYVDLKTLQVIRELGER